MIYFDQIPPIFVFVFHKTSLNSRNWVDPKTSQSGSKEWKRSTVHYARGDAERKNKRSTWFFMKGRSRARAGETALNHHIFWLEYFSSAQLPGFGIDIRKEKKTQKGKEKLIHAHFRPLSKAKETKRVASRRVGKCIPIESRWKIHIQPFRSVISAFCSFIMEFQVGRVVG